MNIGKLFNSFLVSLIRIYQKVLSPDQSFWAKYINVRFCIYTPSCSQYTIEAIQKHGAIAGIVMGIFRIGRCNGMHRPGADPVPDTFSLKRNTSSG